MTYTLTPEDVASITDPEAVFGTERLLPAWESIPAEFKSGNSYTKLAEAIFYGSSMPSGRIELKAGFEPMALNRAVRAHLQSYGPRHEHKIAGVGFLISQAAVFHQVSTR